MKHTPTGELDKRIKVYEMTLTGKVGELGEDIREPDLVGTFWANIESRTGSLLKGRTADTVLTDTTHVITLRYTKSIKPEHYIEYGGMRFDIDYISDPDFSRRWLEVFVRGNWI